MSMTAALYMYIVESCYTVLVWVQETGQHYKWTPALTQIVNRLVLYVCGHGMW